MMRLSEAVGWYLMLSSGGTKVQCWFRGVMLREQGKVYVNVNDRFVSLFKKMALPKLVIDKVPKYCSGKGYSISLWQISG